MRSYYLVNNEIKSFDEPIGEEWTAEKSATETVLSDINVLVVDDSAINLMVADKTLQKFGATSVKAYSGKEALKLFEAQRFDLILMDLHMPGLDGFETSDLLQATETFKNHPAPIMAYTTYAYNEVTDKIIAHKMSGYIGKPFTQAQVINSVFAVLRISEEAQ